MKREVLLTIAGEQTDRDGRSEKNTTVSNALYERRGGVHRLSYEDTDPESGVKTESVIRISEKAVLISRRGEVQTGMRLIAGKVTACRYATPYGTLEMELDTRQITILESESIIEADVLYKMRLGGAEAVRSRVTIVVRPRDRI